MSSKNMSEYPLQTCGDGETPKAPNPTFFKENTIPEPRVKFHDNLGPKEYKHGIPSTNQNPDLTVSPIDGTKHEVDADGSQRNLSRIASQDDETSKNLEGSPSSCLHKDEEQKSKGLANIDCPATKTPEENKLVPQPRSILKNKSDPLQSTTCTCNCIRPSSETHTTAGIPPQHAMPTLPTEPTKLPPSEEIPSPPEDRGACYLPQPQDALPLKETGQMGPIGPWATGRVDWSHLAGLTGTRPVVDKYSIARYSEGDWRSHNKVILDMANTEKHRANLIDWNSRQCLEQSQEEVKINQEDNTKKLNQRELEIHRWKCELERAIAAASEEIFFMEEQRRRLKQASSVLTWPESIAGECLERRTGRMDAELVRDEPEEELIKELALCSEIRDIFNRTLRDVEKQLVEDKTAKQKLEMDWSDKTVAHDIDSINMALNCRSTTLLFKPGSVIFPEGQSSTDYWEHFTRETLLEGEATRQRSVTLRGTLDAILVNAARDLRTQADKVELALAKRIACTEEVTKRLESELLQILRRLADVEDLIKELRAAIRRIDTPMKKAQTRLDNRLLRPRVENCRDAPHFGLVEEVKSISENIAALTAQLNEAERSQRNLINGRSELEREIMLKRKTLEIDADRTRKIRSFYPSAAALSGY